MILPIYLYGSQVLRTPAQEDTLSDRDGLRQLIGDMVETMHHADGCGLAAPQIGVSRRILVVDGRDLTDRYPELDGFHREMINPRYTYESEETCSFEEGCLSIPNVDAEIARPARIRVRYVNADFEETEEAFEGFAARMIQHEMDHLDGILFVDHASPIRRKMLSGKLAGISKGHVRTRYRVKSDKK